VVLQVARFPLLHKSLICLVFGGFGSWLHVASIKTSDIVVVLKQKLVSVFFFGILNRLYHFSFVYFDGFLQNLIRIIKRVIDLFSIYIYVNVRGIFLPPSPLVSLESPFMI
jgi:hypothetical protein